MTIKLLMNPFLTFFDDYEPLLMYDDTDDGPYIVIIVLATIIAANCSTDDDLDTHYLCNVATITSITINDANDVFAAAISAIAATTITTITSIVLHYYQLIAITKYIVIIKFLHLHIN